MPNRKDQTSSPNNLQCPDVSGSALKVSLAQAEERRWFSSQVANLILAKLLLTLVSAVKSTQGQRLLTAHAARQASPRGTQRVEDCTPLLSLLFLVQQQIRRIMVKYCCIDNTVYNQVLCDTEMPFLVAEAAQGWLLLQWITRLQRDRSMEEVGEQKRYCRGRTEQTRTYFHKPGQIWCCTKRQGKPSVERRESMWSIFSVYPAGKQ